MRQIIPLLLGLTLVLAGCAGNADPKTAPSTSGTVGTVNVGDNSTGDSGSIVGKIIDDEEKPLGGATVALVALDAKVDTSADGSFEFKDVPPGTHKLVANKLGYDSIAKNVEVVAGTPSDVTLMLNPIAVDESYIDIKPHTALHHFAATQYTTWAISQATDPAAACSGCGWTIKDVKVPDLLLIESFGKHSYSSPQGDKEYFWLLHAAGGQVGGENKEYGGNLPVRIDYTKEQLGKSNKEWFAQILCDPYWFCFEEKRDVWMSFFYGYEEVPEGYTAGPVG